MPSLAQNPLIDYSDKRPMNFHRLCYVVLLLSRKLLKTLGFFLKFKLIHDGFQKERFPKFSYKNNEIWQLKSIFFKVNIHTKWQWLSIKTEKYCLHRAPFSNAIEKSLIHHGSDDVVISHGHCIPNKESVTKQQVNNVILLPLRHASAIADYPRILSSVKLDKCSCY